MSPGVTSSPQFGQRFRVSCTTGVPQRAQKVAPGRRGAPQLRQVPAAGAVAGAGAGAVVVPLTTWVVLIVSSVAPPAPPPTAPPTPAPTAAPTGPPTAAPMAPPARAPAAPPVSAPPG